MKTTTVIVNSTNDVLQVKMAGHQHNAEVASIDKGGKWDLHFNVNETYREFRLQDASGTTAVIVSSDECCDNECITIKEHAAAADDNNSNNNNYTRFEVHRVPRRQLQQVRPAVISLSSKAHNSSELTWFGWLRQLWTRK